MKPHAPETEKDPRKQLKTFEHQPPKTKELELIKDQAEKSTGQERIDLIRKIRASSTPPEGPKAA
jgi:hypothetical protein